MNDAPRVRERRSYPRHSLNFSMRFRRLDSQTPLPNPFKDVEMAGTDISIGGLGGVASLEALGKVSLRHGERMMLELDLNDGKPTIMAAAKVAWDRTLNIKVPLQCAGFQFVYIADEAKARIYETIGKISGL